MKRRITKEEAAFNALVRLPKNRTKKSESRKAWIKKADDAFALYIRTRDRVCRHCGNRNNQTQCSHVVSRTYKILRWDSRNALGLCFHCHIPFWHDSPVESGAWYRENFAEDWAYLEKKKLEKWSPTIDELKAICEKYTNLTYNLA